MLMLSCLIFGDQEHFDAVSEQPPDSEPPEPSPFDDQEFYTSVVRKTGISALYAGKTGEAEDAFDEGMCLFLSFMNKMFVSEGAEEAHADLKIAIIRDMALTSFEKCTG